MEEVTIFRNEEMNDLPEGWQKVKLSEVLKYEQPTNYIVKSENYDEQFGIPVLTAGKTFILGYTDEGKSVFKDIPVIIFDDFTTESRYITFPFKVKSSALKILRLRNDRNNLYCLYAIMQLLNFRPGSEHKRFWISEFSNLYVALPPSSEQLKIAEILETVDKTIDKTDALIEKYKRLKHGLMQELLTKGIDENGHIRSEKTHKFKDSPLGRIPEEWKVLKLGQVCKEILSGATPDKSNVLFWNDQAIPWLTNEEVDEDKINYIYGTKTKVSEVALKKSNISLIPQGSLILSLTASVGKIAINIIPLCTNQQFNSFVLKKEILTSQFLAYYLLLEKKRIRGLGGLTTFDFISKSQIKGFEIAFPGINEQQKIAFILSKADEVIEKEEAYKAKLERIKRGLMEDLLTGKIRVNDL